MKKEITKKYNCPDCGKTIVGRITYLLDSEEPNYIELLKDLENQAILECAHCGFEGEIPVKVTYIDRKHNYRIVYANTEGLIKETMVELEKDQDDTFTNRVVPYDYGMFLAKVMMIDLGYDDLAIYLYQGFLLKNSVSRMEEDEGFESMAIAFDYESNSLRFDYNTNLDTYEYEYNKEEYEKVLNSELYKKVASHHNYLVDDKVGYLAVINNETNPTHIRFFFDKKIRVYLVRTREGEVEALSSYNLPVSTNVSIEVEGKVLNGEIIKANEMNEFDYLVEGKAKSNIIDLSFEMNRRVMEEHMSKVIFKQNELNHDHLCISGLEITFRPNELDAINVGDILSNKEELFSFYPLRGKTNRTRVYIFGTKYEFKEGKTICVSKYDKDTKFFVVDKYIENEVNVLYLLALQDESWIYYNRTTLDLVRKQEEIKNGYYSIENRMYEENNVGYKEEFDIDMENLFEINYFIDHSKITKYLSNILIDEN